MYCPNCGKPNSDADRFCMYCGAELIDNQNFGEVSPAEQLRDTARALAHSAGDFCRRHKKAVAGVVAAVVVVLIIAGAWEAMFSPKSVAVTYFKAVMSGDASSAYSCLDIVASPFTDQDDFDTFWSNSFPARDLYNYTVSEESTGSGGEDSIEHTFDFRYYLRGDDTPYSMSVTVIEAQGIASYKVLPDFVVTDYSVSVPRGVSVTFGGQTLSDPMQGNFSDVYTLPAVFTMPYELDLTGDLFIPLSDLVIPQRGETYTCDAMTINEQTADALFSTACTQMDEMIASILTYSEFPADIALTEESSAPDTYDQMRSYMVDPQEGTGYYSISITDHVNKSETQSTSANITYTCSMDLPYNYTRLYKSWTGEVSASDGSDKTRAELTYRYENDQWKLDSMYVSGF